MKYSDIFKKSDVGRDEIKYQSLGVLPREARTLLIMIDGKRSYQNYIDSLDDSKIFAEFGGVTPLFELLLELGCIEIVGAPDVPMLGVPMPSRNTQSFQPRTLATQDFDDSIEREFDKTFNQRELNIATTFDSSAKSSIPHPNYETIKSDLAAFIESNAPPEESWGYLLNLEQCSNPNQLLSLVRQMQTSTNQNLLQGLDGFAKNIQNQV